MPKIDKEVREARKQKRRAEQTPRPREYQLRKGTTVIDVKSKYEDGAATIKTRLPSGKKIEITCRVKPDTVRRVARALGQKIRLPKPKKVKGGKKEKFLIVEVPVTSTHISIEFGKHSAKARSCCKPPDKFNSLEGKRLALTHLFRKNEVKENLTNEDKEWIVRLVCPEAFEKTHVVRTLCPDAFTNTNGAIK